MIIPNSPVWQRLTAPVGPVSFLHAADLAIGDLNWKPHFGPRGYNRPAPVDYALFLNRTECLFVEAKSLEKDLSDRKWVSQNLSYATVVGVRWCVLTNGDEYRIYNSHAPGRAVEGALH